MLGKHCLDAGFGQFFNILEQTCFKRGVFFQKVDAKKKSHICPNCLIDIHPDLKVRGFPNLTIWISASGQLPPP